VSQPGFFGDVGERAVVIVAVEVAGRRFVRTESFQLRAVDDENVRPAVVVVIKNGDSCSRRFDDVLFRCFAAENNRCAKSAFCAKSVKCAIGLAFALSDLAVLTLGELADCMESQAQSPKKQRSLRKENGESSISNDSKVRSTRGNLATHVAKSEKRASDVLVFLRTLYK